MLTTKLKSFNTFVNFATTSSSSTLSLTEIGLIVIPISTGRACGLTISKKYFMRWLCKSLINTKKNMKEINQQAITFFDMLNRKRLQDNVIDENEYESLSNLFTKFLEETKMNFFINMNIKVK